MNCNLLATVPGPLTGRKPDKNGGASFLGAGVVAVLDLITNDVQTKQSMTPTCFQHSLHRYTCNFFQYIRIPLYTYLCLCICKYICTYTHKCIHIHVYIYIFMYIHIHIHIHIHIYIYIFRGLGRGARVLCDKGCFRSSYPQSSMRSKPIVFLC